MRLRSTGTPRWLGLLRSSTIAAAAPLLPRARRRRARLASAPDGRAETTHMDRLALIRFSSRSFAVLAQLVVVLGCASAPQGRVTSATSESPARAATTNP